MTQFTYQTVALICRFITAARQINVVYDQGILNQGIPTHTTWFKPKHMFGSLLGYILVEPVVYPNLLFLTNN
jgi:hypothetical protein